jgi:hypothetical protein
MAIVQTDDMRVVRDTETRALLATDTNDLLHKRHTRQRTKHLLKQTQAVDDRFNTMNARLDRCETLLQELVQHLSTLTTKYPSATE